MRLLKSVPFIVAGLIVFAIGCSYCYGFDITKVTDTSNIDEKDYSVATLGNDVYAIWRDIDTARLFFDKSEDLGRTWGENLQVIGFSGGYNSQYMNYPNKILTDKSGDLFVLYKDSNSLFMLKSTDGGRNFVNCGAIPLQVSEPIFDFAVDETGNTIYVACAFSDTYFCKSTDGGATFSDPKTVFSGFATTEIKIVTSRDGNELYVFAVNNHQVHNIGTPPLVWRTRVDFTKSLDGGATFDQLKSVLPAEWPGLDTSYRHWASNISAATDKNGKIYVSWTIKPNWNLKTFIALSESVNQGRTFTSAQISDVNVDSDKSSISADDAGDVCVGFLKAVYSGTKITAWKVYFDKRIVKGAFGADTYVGGPLDLQQLTEPFISLVPIEELSRPAIALTPNGHAASVMWRDAQPAGSDHDIYIRKFFILNKAPVLNPIGAKTVNEGQTLDFTLSTTDTDNDILTYSVTKLPTGAQFDPGTGHFIWTPDYNQDKSYTGIKFTVSDGALTDYEAITIKVNNVNRPPVMEPIGNKSVDEGSLLQFTVKASDPDTVTDNQKLTYSAINFSLGSTSSALPAGAAINSSTGVFTWKPTYKQVGHYIFAFVASDGKLSASDTVWIDVNDVFFPDLTFGPITYTPANPAIGQTVTFKVPVMNIGNEIADKFTVRFEDGYIYRDTPLTFEKTVSQLAAGKTQILSFAGPATNSIHVPTFIVDAYNEVKESNEGNNIVQITVPVH